MKKYTIILLAVLCVFLCACVGNGTPVETSGVGGDITTPSITTPAVSTSDTTTPDVSTDVPVPPLEIKSGKLTSGYGEGIDLVLQWTAVPNGEDYEITFELSLDCYSLFVGARKDGSLIVDGRKFTVVNDALEFPENERRQIFLGTYTANCASGQIVPVSAKWHFNGNYAGIQYEWIELSGEIDLR